MVGGRSSNTTSNRVWLVVIVVVVIALNVIFFRYSNQGQTDNDTFSRLREHVQRMDSEHNDVTGELKQLKQQLQTTLNQIDQRMSGLVDKQDFLLEQQTKHTDNILLSMKPTTTTTPTPTTKPTTNTIGGGTQNGSKRKRTDGAGNRSEFELAQESAKNFAYATLVAGDQPHMANALVVLVHSARQAGCSFPWLILHYDPLDVVQGLFTPAGLAYLEELGAEFHEIEKFPASDAALAVPLYDWWRIALNKMQVWTLTRYHKIVLMDADVLVYKNMDLLFSFPELMMAADQCTNPGKEYNNPNSGLLVLEPDQPFHDHMVQWVADPGNHQHLRWGDQKAITLLFTHGPVAKGYTMLPYPFNLCPLAANPSFGKAWTWESLYSVHFYCHPKPWEHETRPLDSSQAPRDLIFLRWYSIFDELALQEKVKVP